MAGIFRGKTYVLYARGQIDLMFEGRCANTQ